MFTGLIEERGNVFWHVTVREGEDGEPEGGAIFVTCPKVAADARPGDSIAVDGVCLTVTERKDDTLTFELSEETLRRSTFGGETPRTEVNLERPVTLATRLGGHLVQGHVDGVGTVEAVEPEGEGGVRMTVRVPDGLDRYLVEKGSVAVDGVSLTVAGLGEGTFDAALIPHTLAVTTLGKRARGDPVNLEMDVLAKYVERLTRRDG